MTDTISPEASMTLDEAVQEVLVILTGQTLAYDPALDRYRAVAALINRALRTNAREHEWTYYSELLHLGAVSAGDQVFSISSEWRYRVVVDDAVRLVNDAGQAVGWAEVLPNAALHKYSNRNGRWASITRNRLKFNRPLNESEAGYFVEVAVMREPTMFMLPTDPMVAIDPDVREQPVDFQFPDLITSRAAWLYAQTDPVMQPRVQSLEAQVDDLKYQAIELDQAHTDTPYQNEIIVPVQNSIYGESTARAWPVANRR